jgi:hypothetical protein
MLSSSSRTVQPESGCTASGAISAQGSRTNRRVAIRGWGTVNAALVDHQIAVEEEIEIDRPRPPAHAAVAMERVLHRCQQIEQFVRPQLGVDQAGTVEERRLSRWAPHRHGLPRPAHRQQVDPGHEAEQFERPLELLAGLAGVGAASDQATRHGRSLPPA